MRVTCSYRYTPIDSIRTPSENSLARSTYPLSSAGRAGIQMSTGQKLLRFLTEAGSDPVVMKPLRRGRSSFSCRRHRRHSGPFSRLQVHAPCFKLYVVSLRVIPAVCTRCLQWYQAACRIGKVSTDLLESCLQWVHVRCETVRLMARQAEVVRETILRHASSSGMVLMLLVAGPKYDQSR